MIRCRLILLLLSLTIHGFSAPVDSLDRRPGIPVYFQHAAQPLLSTQLTLSAGTGRVGRTDRPLFSTTVECKGVYYLTGALYVSGGSGFSHMRSQARPASGARYERQVFLAYAPAGIGFSIGDDRATIITAVDVLPGIYIYNGAQPDAGRRLIYGIGPEFGFLFRAGRPHTRGLEIGMTGRVRFSQSADRGDGAGLRYGYGGMGIVLRF